MTDGLVADVRAAYEESADAWATGPARVYRRLAEVLVEASPADLGGSLVLDLGAGTGVGSEVLRHHGARPVGVDLALAMLRHRRLERPPGAVGNALNLPFRAGTFDAVVAAFSLNHLPDPESGLREARRAVIPGGVVLASTFPVDEEHPAKPIVEGVLERFGYRRPGWYDDFKASIAFLTGDPEAFAAAASRAGLVNAGVERHRVAAGLDVAEAVVDWRLNMPHAIGFVNGLEPEARDALRHQAADALPAHLPATVDILVLSARTP